MSTSASHTSGSQKKPTRFESLRRNAADHRRKRINRGGALDVQMCHDMLAALPDAKKHVGGPENVEIAFHMDNLVTADLNGKDGEKSDNATEVDLALKENQVKPATEAGEEHLDAPKEPLKALYGPFLNYMDVDLDQDVWTGNILIVYHESRKAPKIHVHNELDGGRFIEPIILDRNISATGYTAVRYDLSVKLMIKPPKDLIDAADADDPQARTARHEHYETGNPSVSAGWSQKVTYTLDPTSGGSEVSGGQQFEFQVAAKEEPWHWSWFSCNGFGTDEKEPEKDHDGIRPLWKDKLEVHSKRPFHLMVGCGDQIYQDDLFFHCRSLKDWLNIFDAYERESYEFTPEMQAEVERFYFMHYLAHFGQPVLSDALARIPSLNICDDHDIFDGFGSYPDKLQMCPVFQAIGAIALRFFLLFQQHTVKSRARDEKLWGGAGGYNFLRLMGPRTAIFGSDGRFERKKTQVCDPKTWDLLFNEHLAKLPNTVEHLIFAAGVPVSFPVLGVTEKIMNIVSAIRRWSGFRKLFRFSGMYKKLGLAFGEPSNLDDLVDHWNSDFHIDERNTLIERFQDFCKQRSIRVTIIAGDVHCAAVAQLRTQGDFDRASKHVYEVPPLQDHRLMYNIVSSAIGNVPPPKIVLKMFQWSSSRRPVKNVKQTTEGLVHVFQHDVDGKRNKKGHRKIMARRNWCEVDEIVPRYLIEAPTDDKGNEVQDDVVNRKGVVRTTPELSIFRLRFEPPKNKPEVKIGVYHVSIPRLVVGEKAEDHPEIVKLAEERKNLGVGLAEMDERVADCDEVEKTEGASTEGNKEPISEELKEKTFGEHVHNPGQTSNETRAESPSSGAPLTRQEPNEWPGSPRDNPGPDAFYLPPTAETLPNRVSQPESH
ncbi:hypothetical protein PhCBS80983_g02761 [Powellomyces hirtus]|uniref:PhoD-like phosphatase domain-containing protein n=1 Tax=Powellomyces hirtus TaxID=109895 RepID=A0A507E563_9FUNG|nr:hypothetical protein PhCBS80983_g02761 [Powellomyces hirtus]